MGFFLALALTAGMAGSEDDRRALVKLEEDFAAAWNKGDAAAMAAVWAEEGDLVNPAGRLAHGRAEIEKMFTADQAGPFKNTHFAITCPEAGVRIVKSDVAVVDCSWEVTGMKNPAGQPAPPLKGVSTGVALKSGGRWRWIAGRAFVPLPPLPPPPPPKP